MANLQSLLQSFLLRNRYCPLPGIGSLVLQMQSSQLKDAGTLICAPVYQISLSPEVKHLEPLLSYLTYSLLGTKEDAQKLLHEFCEGLKNGLEASQNSFSIFGQWIKLSDGHISFVGNTWHHAADTNEWSIPLAVHEDAEHRVRVGEDDRSSTEMQEVIQKIKSGKNKFRWVSGVILITMIIGVFTYLYFAGFLNSHFGLFKKVQLNDPPATYQSIP
jgi:hypothetical protein